jgi:hypothetical protein
MRYIEEIISISIINYKIIVTASLIRRRACSYLFMFISDTVVENEVEYSILSRDDLIKRQQSEIEKVCRITFFFILS